MVNYSAVKVGNNVKGNLASSLSPGDNHFTLVEGQGARFPSVVETASGEKESYFFVVITSAANPNNTQIYKVDDRFNDRCNLTSAGAPANNGHTFSAGDPVELRLNANFLDDTFDIDNLVPSDELFIPVPVNRKTWRFQQPAIDEMDGNPGAKLYRGAPKYIGGKTILTGGFPPDRYRLFRGTNSFFSFGYEVDTTPDTVEELGPLTAIRDNISATSTGINLKIGFLVENREPAFIYQSNGTNVELKFSNPDGIADIVNTSTSYLALPVRSHPYIISVHQSETGVWTTDIKEGATAHYNNNTLRLDYSENSAANPLTPGQGLFDARFGTSRYGKLARYPNIYFNDGHASGQLSARYKYTNDTLGNVNGGDTEFAINGYTYAFKSQIQGGDTDTSIQNANNPTELPVKNTRGSDTFINNEAHDIVVPHGSIVYLGNTGGTTRVSFINNTLGSSFGLYNGNVSVETYADIPNSYGGWLHTFQNVSNACGIFMYYEHEGAIGDGFQNMGNSTNSGNYIDSRRFQRLLSPLSAGNQQQGSSTIVSHVDANNPKFGVTTFGASNFAIGNDPNRNANNFSKGQATSKERFNQLHTSGGGNVDNYWSVPLNSQGNLFHHLLGLEILPLSPWRFGLSSTVLNIPFGTYISKVEVRQASNGAAGPGGDATQVGSGTLAANYDKRSFKLHFSNPINFPATSARMVFYRSRRNQLGKEYSAAWHDGPYYKRETSAPTTVSMNGWTDNEKNVKHDAYMPIAGQIANVYFTTDQNQTSNNRSTTPLEGNGFRETTQRTITMGLETVGGFGAPYTVKRIKCKPVSENSVFEVSFGGTTIAASAGYIGIHLHMDVYNNDPQPNNTRIFKGANPLFSDSNIKASFLVANYMHNDAYYPVELLNASTLFDEKYKEGDKPTEFNSHIHGVNGENTAKLQPFRAEFANGRMTSAAEPNHNSANNQNGFLGQPLYMDGNKNGNNPYNTGTLAFPLGFSDDLPYFQSDLAHVLSGSSASIFIRPGVTDFIAFRLTIYHINTGNGSTSLKSTVLPQAGSGAHLMVEEHTQPENKFGFNIEGGLDTTAQWQGYNF